MVQCARNFDSYMCRIGGVVLMDMAVEMVVYCTN